MSRATRESGRAKHHAKHGTNPPDDIQNPAATGDAMPTSSSPTMSKRGKERRISSNLSSQMKRVVDNSSSAAAATERRRASDASPQQHRRRDVARRASTSAAVGPPSGVGFSGSFDDSRYWDYAFRQTQRQDIGNQCRECKRPFLSLNEEIAVRRGGRIELRYHKECFSMVADPRSQPASSANVGKFVESLKGTVAPEELYRKMRTRGHW